MIKNSVWKQEKLLEPDAGCDRTMNELNNVTAFEAVLKSD